MDGIIVLTATLYLLFSFVTMNAFIVESFIDSAIRPTVKRILIGFGVMFLMVIIVAILGNVACASICLLSFVYIIYPAILMWEKQKDIGTYKAQLCSFVACELVTIIGITALVYTVIYGVVDFTSISITIIFVFLGTSFVLISISIYMKYIRYNIAMLYSKNENLIIIIYVIMSTFIITINSLLLYFDYNVIVIFFQKSISVVLLVLLPLLMKKDRESTYYTEQSLRNEYFLEMQLISYNTYREAQEDTRAFRHDINNNLAYIATLMQEKKYIEAERYIRELNSSIASLSPKIVTGDDMLDTLLLSKLSLIKHNNINFSVKGVIAGGIGWKALDVCTVFSNLIDNAVEACQKVENKLERYIEFDFRHTNFQKVITIRNSVNNTGEFSNINSNSRYTTKADKQNHGYGIKNVRQVIAKNNAMIQMKCNGKVFEVDIVIMK